MPYKYRGVPYTAQKPAPRIGLHLERVYDAVASVVDRVLDDAAAAAYRTAMSRVPVRKVWKGGRKTPRKLTITELVEETPAFLRSLPPDVRRRLKASSSGGFIPERLGVRTIAAPTGNRYYPNRANTWRVEGKNRWREVGEDRLLYLDTKTNKFNFGKEREPGLVGPASREEAQYRYRRLNAEAKADVRNAKVGRIPGSAFGRRIVGRSMISVVPGTHGAAMPRFYLGGSLKRSIRVDRASKGTIRKVSVIAGDSRVDYARYVEFGTRHAPAQPFLRPALKGVEIHFADRMRFALEKELGSDVGASNAKFLGK